MITFKIWRVNTGAFTSAGEAMTIGAFSGRVLKQ